MARNVPTLDGVLAKLRELGDVEEINPDTPIVELDVDSLDVMEWLYALEEDLDAEFNEDMLQGLDFKRATIREVYNAVMSGISFEAPSEV